MKLKIAKPDDRDAVIVILARNGYTVPRARRKSLEIRPQQLLWR